ncbi:MAG: hypothetical protein JOZ72_17100 [Alphaproteobacteria bacterium]|nr:hypothetical protein [Alphaproteobacteria bacterium]
MLKKTILTALLAGAALFAASPSWAERVHPTPVGHEHPAWRHPGAWHGGGWRGRGWGARERFVFRHDFRHLSPIEHRWWVGGHWHHMRWHGRWGWWWGVGGAFYWYPTPVYPYPEDISSTYYYDDQDEDGDYGDYQGVGPGDQGGGMWYHCASPEGYYPYVKECKGGWESVPAEPDMQGGDMRGGGYDQGPPPGYDRDDRGYNDRDDRGYNDRNDQGQDDQDDDDQGPPPPPRH